MRLNYCTDLKHTDQTSLSAGYYPLVDTNQCTSSIYHAFDPVSPVLKFLELILVRKFFFLFLNYENLFFFVIVHLSLISIYTSILSISCHLRSNIAYVKRATERLNFPYILLALIVSFSQVLHFSLISTCLLQIYEFWSCSLSRRLLIYLSKCDFLWLEKMENIYRTIIR